MMRILLPETAQEVFDIVVRGAHAQGWAKAVDLSGRCMYRTPKGLKCHGGHLLPETLPEGYLHISWGGLVSEGVVEARHEKLVEALQVAHDTTDSPKVRARITYEVGLRHDLTWPSDVPEVLND